VLSPALKEWLRSVICFCERTLSNAAFRSAHQTACLAPDTIDSISLLKVLGLAQCISIDITFADLLSVNESTATSLFGSVSLFQSLSPEHIQRVQHAIADAISDHRATDAMLSFCSATSADGVYAMNIKQQVPSLLSRRASTVSTGSALLLIETSGIDDSQSVMSPLSSTNLTSLADSSESLIATAITDSAISHITNPPESALMFVRIGRLTSDGKTLMIILQMILLMFHLCLHTPFIWLIIQQVWFSIICANTAQAHPAQNQTGLTLLANKMFRFYNL